MDDDTNIGCLLLVECLVIIGSLRRPGKMCGYLNLSFLVNKYILRTDVPDFRPIFMKQMSCCQEGIH